MYEESSTACLPSTEPNKSGQTQSAVGLRGLEPADVGCLLFVKIASSTSFIHYLQLKHFTFIFNRNTSVSHLLRYLDFRNCNETHASQSKAHSKDTRLLKLTASARIHRFQGSIHTGIFSWCKKKKKSRGSAIISHAQTMKFRFISVACADIPSEGERDRMGRERAGENKRTFALGAK